MKINENTAITTADILLVPYDRRHVPTYHAWMEDDALRAATASDRLTLDEEYENQVSWRAAPDKLTFILCRRGENVDDDDDGRRPIVAGVDDAPDRMLGDINFFLQPEEEEEGDDDDGTLAYTGEIDVMVARDGDRGRGVGRAAVTALLRYLLQPAHLTAILHEAAGADADGRPAATLRRLMVKIQATNTASIRLFTRLGFEQRGAVNYFGEVELVREALAVPAVRGYAEREYRR